MRGVHHERRARGRLVAVAAGLGLISLLVLRIPGSDPRSDEEQPPAVRAEAADRSAPAATGKSREPTGDGGRRLTETVAEPRRRALPGVDVARQAADEYRRRARYPRWAQPIAPGEVDPIARDREVTPVEQRGPGGSEPALVVQPAQASFEAPEPAVLFAHLAVRGVPVAAREITGTVLTEDLRPIGEVVYRDDGDGGDPVAGDRRWTAVVALPAEATPQLSASILVQVRAVTAGGEERRAATSFQYARPHARLTGRWRDTVVDGSLVVAAEVEVLEAGRFHLEATLYDAGGTQPVAWAQAAATLPPGVHWIDLGYYGLVLRERGVDGPYLVRHAALSTTGTMPNAKNRLVVDAHRTAPYRAATFTGEPFDDPDLLEAARRLEGMATPAGPEAGG